MYMFKNIIQNISSLVLLELLPSKTIILCKTKNI